MFRPSFSWLLGLIQARSERIAFLAMLVISIHLLAFRTVNAEVPSALSPAPFVGTYAIVGGKVIDSTSKVFTPGTVVIRRGIISKVGPASNVEIPADAEVIDAKGMFVYPGFVNLYSTQGQRGDIDRSLVGRGRPVDLAEAPLVWTPRDNRRGLTPEFLVANTLEISDSMADPFRKQGFTTLLSAPSGAIATGQSAFASLGGLNRREATLRSPIAFHFNLKTPIESGSSNAPPASQPGSRRRSGESTGGENPYPRSLMGAVTHLRQAMIDAEHHHAQALKSRGDIGKSLPFDPALDALQLTQGENGRPVWWEANTRDEIHRALDLAKEFHTKAIIVGGSEVFRVLNRLSADKIPVVLRLDFPEEPKVPTEEEYQKKSIADREEPLSLLKERHRRWKEQVGNAALLAKAGIPFGFSLEGLERTDQFSGKIRAVISAGLSQEAALFALTTGAARIARVQDLVGSLESGKLGHLTVMTAPLGDEKAKVRFVFVDGQKFENKPTDQASSGESRGRDRRGTQSQSDAKETLPSTPNQKPSETRPPSTDKSDSDSQNRRPPSRQPESTEPKTKSGEAKDSTKPRGNKPISDQQVDQNPPKDESKPDSKPKANQTSPAPDFKPRRVPVIDTATEFDENRKPKLRTDGNVLIRDATILTVTKGIIPQGSILIIDGKITAVGSNVSIPEDDSRQVEVIEAAGLVAMPGIIDTHSHIAIQGSVNELSLSVVPEIRVKDVVAGDDVSIYRALAGGTTTARLLHGSANTIGGQDAVIKLRYGKSGKELIVHDGPQGVKFALGENVTRSRGRFPNTRMGVQSVIDRAFLEAKAYQGEWKAYEAFASKVVRPNIEKPRRDLRLEALARILDGTIKVHSHCYRADEILMLLGTAEKHGVKIQSLQHVLEGYKVAAEIAAHGASTSTFSDWWGYKIEAFDAIPQNAAILHQAGANVCIKSDSEELIRHLNLEAAKIMKYGGVSETTALSMITINPARELGLDGRLGSIEIGKDGDIALFNGHPLDAFSRCELSLIDGEVYFQRSRSSGKQLPNQSSEASRALTIAKEASRTQSIELTTQPKGVFALRGATIHTVSKEDIKDGVLVVENGKIAAIGTSGTAVLPEAQTIDLAGLDIWPGMVDAGSDTALSEVGSLAETQDFADSAQFQPELRTSFALKADSVHIPVTRSNGILTAYVQPTGGVIAGQGCAINLQGWTPSEMIISDTVALHVNIPARISDRDGSERSSQSQEERSEARKRRQELLDRLKEEFRRALRFDRARASAIENGTRPPIDPRLEAMVPYSKGLKPVIFRATRRGEILDAISIAKELKLKAILSEAWDAWKVVNEIRDANIPVLLAGTLHVPTEEHDPYDAPYSSPARLHEAGITFAIRSNGRGAAEATASRNLPYEAAMAVAFGLPRDQALKAITLTPARILGIDSQVGSIDVGKRANLIITAGHLLQPTTRVLLLFINGKLVRPESRQTELKDRYLGRLKELQERKANSASPLNEASGATLSAADEPSK